MDKMPMRQPLSDDPSPSKGLRAFHSSPSPSQEQSLREKIIDCFKRTHMQTEGDTELFDTETTIDRLEILVQESNRLRDAQWIERLTKETVKARKEQIMQDFLSLNVEGLGAEDETMLIQWRDEQLEALKDQQGGEA